jgi:hypothetical protein
MLKIGAAEAFEKVCLSTRCLELRLTLSSFRRLFQMAVELKPGRKKIVGQDTLPSGSDPRP